ncbi:MAG: nucleoside deaminase [Anaerolineaceae bacterium]|nr:nucleoside deaminase [Anaerolineaceae bacterium]
MEQNYSEDEKFIRMAISLAEKSAIKGNHPFGAVLVKDGKALHEFENKVITGQDVSYHPEFLAAQMAGKKYDPVFLKDCTLYASTEPCPMCSGAIYWSGIKRIVYGCSKETLGKYAGKGFGINIRDLFQNSHQPPEIIGPVLEDEAAKSHENFW